jgi:hypothetical protein
MRSVRTVQTRAETAERTNFPREVAEAALAHAIDDKVD